MSHKSKKARDNRNHLMKTWVKPFGLPELMVVDNARHGCFIRAGPTWKPNPETRILKKGNSVRSDPETKARIRKSET